MDTSERKRLEAAGFRVTTAEEFVGLSPEEAALVELKIELARTIGEARKAAGLTQAELARRLGSSQSRVAKLEAADPSVSLELLFRAAFALGVAAKALARAIGAARTKAPAAKSMRAATKRIRDHRAAG